MKKLFTKDGLALAAGEVRIVQAGEAGRLSSLSGRLWITVIGQPDDHWLAAGQALRLCAHDRIVVEAEAGAGDAMLIFSAPIKPSIQRRGPSLRLRMAEFCASSIAST